MQPEPPGYPPLVGAAVFVIVGILLAVGLAIGLSALAYYGAWLVHTIIEVAQAGWDLT